jgi:hypothetical protein
MVCFYIHSDGYPEGQQIIFTKCIIVKIQVEGWPVVFLEQTIMRNLQRHEAHGDTEFQYTINIENELRVWRKERLAIDGASFIKALGIIL